MLRRQVSRSLLAPLSCSTSSSLVNCSNNVRPFVRVEGLATTATNEDTQDVVIAGGGVIGSSIAYFLASHKSGPKRITVVEKDPTYRMSSTTLSASAIRHQFSTPENIKMCQFGTHFLRNVDQYLHYEGGPNVDVHFKEGGYLFLASDKIVEPGKMGGKQVLETNYKVQKSLGVDVVLLTPEGIKERFPWISTDGISCGSLGLRGEGWFEPSTLLMGFKQKAQSLGVTYLRDEVVSMDLNEEKTKVTAVKTKGGKTIKTGLVVNSAGAQANKIAKMIGEEGLPVRARKRCIYVFDCKDKSITNSPLVIDPSGVYWRPEGDRFICGFSPAIDPDVQPTDFEVDYKLFEDEIWPVLAHRVPAFEAIKMAAAWAGHYEFNTFDHNAILGPHSKVKNFYFANGFSGHGLQQSPAAGRGMSELILDGKFTSIDLTAFSFDRLAQNKPIVELNVV